jgi:hypothetical protein
VEVISPSVVFDLYKSLQEDGQAAFRKLLATTLRSNGLLDLTRDMSAQERLKYLDVIGGFLALNAFPIMARYAVKFAHQFPHLTDEQMHSKIMESMDALIQQIGSMQAEQFKSQRDRKSKPETIKRNVEICDLRKKDRRKWTLGKLAKDHRVTPRAITRILSQENKWRRLAATLGTN